MIQDIKKTLWSAADKLRANTDAAEYKHLVLGLTFLKYVSDSFAAHRADLTRHLTDESDPCYLGDADNDLLEAELEYRDYSTAENVFWVLVPLPPYPDALKKAAAALRENIDHNNPRADFLGQLRDTLLPRLISGRLRLSET